MHVRDDHHSGGERLRRRRLVPGRPRRRLLRPPQDAPLDHALCVDVWGAAGRVAVELGAASARRLAEAILATLDHDEVAALGG